MLFRLSPVFARPRALPRSRCRLTSGVRPKLKLRWNLHLGTMQIHLRDPPKSFHRTWRAFLPLRLTSPQIRISPWYQFGCKARVAGRISPALATRRVVVEGDLDAVGVVAGIIYWVLLVWGCFSVSKTIIPDGQEHFLTPSARRYTHLFGGLGLIH